ncbi:MAG: MauE/DoxX family redox-associated membrane protein [Mycobacteriales bacterium]
MLLQGLVHAAAGLLLLAGLQKVADPRPLVRAARSVGLRVPASAVRAVAACEVLVGLATLLVGSRAAALAVAASYAVFTAFVLLARARGGVLASCGCFGRTDLPPTRTHAAVTAVLALAATTGTPGALPLDPAVLVTTAAVAACGYLVLAVLPLLPVR